MKRYSKTIAQQCKYYEVENIFEYMVETYINGNHSTFTRLFKELEKDARRLFIVGSQSPIPCGNTESNHLKNYGYGQENIPNDERRKIAGFGGLPCLQA